MVNSNGARSESYLVRLARDRRHGPWRASLRKVRTGELLHFAQPEELWAYLQAEMAGEEQPGTREPTGPKHAR